MKVNWSEIKQEYITDEKSSYASLAKKYKLHRNAIYYRSKKEDWLTLRQQRQDEIDILTGEIVVMDIAKFQAAKFKAGMDLAKLGMDKLAELDRFGAVAAKMVTELGWKLSTEALGLDDKATVNNYNTMTQNNMMSIKDLVSAMKQIESSHGSD